MTPEERDLFLTLWTMFGIVGGVGCFVSALVFSVSLTMLNRMGPPPPPPWTATTMLDQYVRKQCSCGLSGSGFCPKDGCLLLIDDVLKRKDRA